MLIVVIGWLVVRATVFDLNEVTGVSMEPALLPGDWLAVERLAYGLRIPGTDWIVVDWAVPLRGDVVILYDPVTGRRLVKRVLGLPGDRVEIRAGKLCVNGEPLADASSPPTEMKGAWTVPAGQFFVLGDNRAHSHDSRSFGPVELRRILGRVSGVALSFDLKNWHEPRWQRFFRSASQEVDRRD